MRMTFICLVLLISWCVARPITTDRFNFFNTFDSFDISYKQVGSTFSIFNKELQLHGTTTLAFKYRNSVIVCVDSKASLGNYVGSRTVKKVIPISSKMIATMAGGAADCSYHIRQIALATKAWSFEYGSEMPVAGVAKALASSLKKYRGGGLSVGTMIAGCDQVNGPSLYYVDSEGSCVQGDLFSVGSGSILAYSILDAQKSEHEEDLSKLSKEEAIDTALRAVKHATYRDGFSGGYINVIEVNQTGTFHLRRVDVQTSRLQRSLSVDNCSTK